MLEPSAGTGLLAAVAELAKARLALNEIADTGAGLLARLFRDSNAQVSRHNAEQIHDRLEAAFQPSVVLINLARVAHDLRWRVEPHRLRIQERAAEHVRVAALVQGGRRGGTCLHVLHASRDAN